MRRIVLRIERLMLRGFRHADRHEIAAGLETELGRLLAEPQAVQDLASRGELTRLDAGRVRIGTSARPHGIGAQAARGIARAIKP